MHAGFVLVSDLRGLYKLRVVARSLMWVWVGGRFSKLEEGCCTSKWHGDGIKQKVFLCFYKYTEIDYHSMGVFSRVAWRIEEKYSSLPANIQIQHHRNRTGYAPHGPIPVIVGMMEVW